MKDKLLHDEYTNVVYFSPWLRYKYKKENHSKFYNRLINLLKKNRCRCKRTSVYQ